MPPPAAPPPLTLDLWLWPLEPPASGHAPYAALLDADERARTAAFATAALRARYTVGRGRMREILAGYLDCPPAQVALSATAQGKPFLRAEVHPDAPAFNLAHAGGWAALVVGAHGLTLGIDIEPVRPVDRAVATISFSQVEQEALAALPDTDWATGFFNGWTRKEALVKALGTGLAHPLDSFDVTLAPGLPARLIRATHDDASAWQLLPLTLGDTFPGCIAVRHSGPIRLVVRQGTLPLPEA